MFANENFVTPTKDGPRTTYTHLELTVRNWANFVTPTQGGFRNSNVGKVV